VNPPKTSLSILIALSAFADDDVDDVFFNVEGGGCDAHIRPAARCWCEDE